MSEINGVIEDLKAIHEGDAWHGPAWKDLLRDVSAAQAAARPFAGAHSIWELVLHVAAWEQTFIQRLQGQTLNEPQAGDFPPLADVSEDAWQQAQAAFDHTHASFIQLLTGLSEADLAQQVAGKEYTTRYLLRGAVRHHVYHAGQIALLRKAINA